MNNELIGIISNEGELKGVLEDNSFNVIVQITESGPKGDQGPKGDKGDKGDPGEVTQAEFDALKDDFTSHLNDYVTYKDSNSLKVAKVEKELNDYKSIMASVNVNQEAKQTASGYGIVSLPKNAANGQVSVTVKGNTETDEEGNTKSTISASRLKSVGKNLFDGSVHNYAGGRYIGDTLLADASWGGVIWEVPTELRDYFKVGQKVSLSYKVTKPNIGDFYSRFHKEGESTSAVNFINIKSTSEVQVGQTLFVNETYTLTNDVDSIYFQVSAGGEVKLWDIQISTSTIVTYEPYTKSEAYLPNVGELRSLPNGVRDEIRVSGGKAELVKRVSNIATIKSTDVTLVQKHGDIVILARVPFTAFENIKPSTVAYENGQITVFNKVPAISSPGVDDVGKWYLTSNSVLTFVLEIGTTLEQAKEQLAGTKLIYQLAEPIITPIDVSGTLLSNSSGTVYVEPVVADAGVYSDGISVLHEGLPIKAVEKVSQVDFATGLETELDIEGIEISTDGLSFTHPELEDGDIVFFEYEYNLEGTTGETEIEFYDSRYTIKDSVTDAFYKWNVAVANGVPSIELVEV